jgi:NAD(P)H dehydrogenase (quinone)
MTTLTILVTGATGQVGGAVAAELRAGGVHVRALVRRDDARSRRLQEAGIEIVLADPYDAQQLFDAMRGVQRGFYLPPYDPYMIQGATAFAVAARQAGLEAVVGLTQWLANPVHPSLLSRQHWLVDRMFESLPGIACTTVRPGFFADNYLRLMPYAAHLGIYPSIYGGGLDAPPSTEDIARVAVEALLDPARHGGRSYRPTGPALLGETDMLAILRRVLGRRVVGAPLPRWLITRAALADGIDPFQLASLFPYIEDGRRGAFGLGAPTTDVEEVTGRPAEDFETVARRYAALPVNRRTLANGLRQFVSFGVMPLRSGLDTERFERALRAPRPSHAVLSANSNVWRRERGLAPLTEAPRSGPGSAVAAPPKVGSPDLHLV